MNNEELGSALSRVHEAAKKHGGNIIPTAEIDRSDRELLLRTQWLQEIIKGWYMLTRPDVLPGDTTAWYANFWDFVKIYLNETYGNDYCFSAENSIDLHIANTAIPKQVIVIVKKGGGKSVSLPFNTSLLPYADPNNFPPERTTVQGLQVMTLPYALCKATPTYFQKNFNEAQIALSLIRNIEELIYVIITYNFVRPGERIIGAYEALAPEKAALIREELKKAGMNLKSVNPFEKLPISSLTPSRSPYAARILCLWEYFRPTIIEHFPHPPGMVKNGAEYIHKMEELYVRDAYHSLSIEGYHVHAELIERVKNHHWNPDINLGDGQERNAMAARGYYEAFLEVKKGILRILAGENSGKVVEEVLQNWFQKLFSTSVHAGILKHSDLLGYRRHQVFIRNSRHIPLPREALLDAMETFFNCLKNEPHPTVRAILGHFIFVFIHPYMDGNGRLGRFIMNAMLASGGYPWTIIEVNNRSEYFSALEQASVEQNILPFTLFVAKETSQSH